MQLPAGQTRGARPGGETCILCSAGRRRVALGTPAIEQLRAGERRAIDIERAPRETAIEIDLAAAGKGRYDSFAARNVREEMRGPGDMHRICGDGVGAVGARKMEAGDRAGLMAAAA